MGLVQSVVVPKTFLVRVGFAVWAGLLLVIVGTLMVGHWYTLPKPDKDDVVLTGALADLRGPEAADSWMAVHVLYTECRCSQRIFDHLFSRELVPGIAERILLVGANSSIEAQAKKSGYGVTVLSPAELREQFALQSAPLLLVTDPKGSIVYSGGYTTRKQGPDIRDVSIITSLMQQQSADELPLYGCGTSTELQAVLDPLGIKY